MKAGSTLEKVLESGQFAVTAELGPLRAGPKKEPFEWNSSFAFGC